MAELISGLRVESVRAKLERVRDRIAASGRDPAGVEVLVAVKYLDAAELPVLAQADIELVGENRAQQLVAKAQAHPGLLRWDFIGHLQSRKVRQILPYVRRIHTVASDSALAALGRHAGPGTEVLIEVNIAREPGKSGIEPELLGDFLARTPVPVVGLMTMPPLAERPEDSRRHFAALAELAASHGLPELSMGTSQDFEVAVQEGATIVRLGSVLLR